MENPLGGVLTFKAMADTSGRSLTAGERGAEAFARLAQQTQPFEVLGPPLADSTPP